MTESYLIIIDCIQSLLSREMQNEAHDEKIDERKQYL